MSLLSHFNIIVALKVLPVFILSIIMSTILISDCNKNIETLLWNSDS